MWRHLWDLDRRSSLTSTTALALCLLLTACGGDGTSVANIPPPPPTPTPTPTPSPAPTGLPAGTMIFTYPSTHPVDIRTSWLNSPATRSGTTAMIGLLSLTPGSGGASSTRPVGPGGFTITTAQPHLEYQYTLSAPSGVLPGGLTTMASVAGLSSWDINDTVAFHYPDNPYGDTVQYFGQNLSGFAKAADGSEKLLFSYDYTRSDGGGGQQPMSANTVLASKLVYDIGYSYVAMGEWSWRVVDMSGNTVPASDSGSLLFVNGDRTPSSGIPVSGTAKYDARSLELLSVSGKKGLPFTLTADFGQRLISTRIDQDYASLASSYFAPGIHVGGSTAFTSDGAFDIPLTGTATLDAPNSLTSVTGTMDGAFFGPHAEQVGGTLLLNRSNGTQMLQDAFVGQQHH